MLAAMTAVRRLALALFALVLLGAPPRARADWRRTHDINDNTAFTLEQGAVEVGVMRPLTVGVTDEFQVAIHPILLLLGQPYLAFRWRATRFGDVTLALNLGGSWSFIRREDGEGNPAESDTPDSGYPGVLQATATLTVKAGADWLFSFGAGPGIDWLGARAVRGLAELHAAIHWRPESSQLLMLHASGYLDVGTGAIERPLVELIYGAALSHVVHVGAGVGVGTFIYEADSGERDTLNVFPVLDLWFRL